MNKGYIYIRQHESFKIHNICKLGETSNIPDRETTYVTGEYLKGEFTHVFEIINITSKFTEKILKNNLSLFHKKENGGTEFYDIKIIDKIENIFNCYNIKYKKLSLQEIKNLTRVNRLKEIFKKIDKNELIKILTTIHPRKDQIEIINKSINYFSSNDNGILVLPCGIGKTLIALWICQKLNFKSILIGVPNILLLQQWKETIQKLSFNQNILLVCDGITQNKLNKINDNTIVITTYSSCYKLLN